MALRKQIGNGTILSVRQPDQSLREDGLERVILFEIEHLDEMGDLGRRFLSVELMGKYSNIILLREDMQILDAIKRIPSSLSSLREVLPGRPYFIPDQSGKKNALSIGEDAFFSALLEHPDPSYAALFHSFSGISPSVASELCFRAGIDPDQPPEHAGGEGLTRLYGEMRKRTEKAVTVQIEESRRELRHLQSILSALDFAEDERDLREIRREMHDFGFIKKAMPKSYSDKNAGAAPASGKGARYAGKPEKVRAKDRAVPYHFRSTDGYEIYVGKNNYQNEQVTFQIAEGGDLWLHAKNIPGSHVIVKTGGESFDKLPDRLFLEAAALAAWFSSHRADSKVEVDYTLRKNLRKVPDAAPGFVIYHTNYSITVQPGLLPEA